MPLPRTIPIPLDEIERAKDHEELKRVLKRFLLQWRHDYERIFEALQTKADKE